MERFEKEFLNNNIKKSKDTDEFTESDTYVDCNLCFDVYYKIDKKTLLDLPKDIKMKVKYYICKNCNPKDYLEYSIQYGLLDKKKIISIYNL